MPPVWLRIVATLVFGVVVTRIIVSDFKSKKKQSLRTAYAESTAATSVFALLWTVSP